MELVSDVGEGEQEIFEVALKNRGHFDAVKKEALLAGKLFSLASIRNLSLKMEENFDKQNTQEEIIGLNLIAAQTEAYLNNAKLYSLLKQWKAAHKSTHKRLLAINVLTEILGQQRSVGSLLSTALQKIIEITNYEIGGVYLLNDKKGNLTLEAAYGLTQDFFDAIETVAVGDKIVGKVAVEGKAVVIDEQKYLNSSNSTIYTKEGLTCGAYIPLFVKKKVIGVIVVGSRVRSEFTPEDVRTLESLSNYFALALQRLKMMERLTQLATIDALTGLYNRRAFFEELETSIARINRHGGKIAILMIDIDFFKQYNDTNGHLEGDKMLKKVAKIIQNNIRAGDIAARYGGEEFVILAHESDMQEAVFLAERLRMAVFKKYYKQKVSFSIGISSYPIHGKDADTLLKRADEALYEAKRNGRNCVKVFQNIDK